MNGTSINNNTATSYEGGGAYLTGSLSYVEMTNSSISFNHGRSGAGLCLSAGSDLVFTSGSISGNRYTTTGSGSGGGISASGDGTTLALNESYVMGNSTCQYGGGIYNSAVTTITNSVISGNTADVQFYSDGGGINNAGSLHIINSTISGNHARRNGGGVAGSALIENSIVWGNTSGLWNPQLSGSPTVASSDVEGGYAGPNNISADPLLVDMQQATSGNPTTSGDFHISDGSPCENAASAQYAPANDIDGEAQPQGAGFDIGADELSSFTDSVGPSIDATWPNGTIYGDSNIISIQYSDPAPSSGVDSASVSVYLDSAPMSGCTVTESLASCPYSGLGAGPHTVTGSVSDNAGNTTPFSFGFTIGDVTAPVIDAWWPKGTLYGDSNIVSFHYTDPAPSSGIDSA